MTLRHLQAFIVVYREGSITKAAEKLYTSQPALSRTIRELENHYGCELFERVGRKLFITPQGEAIAEYAQRILGLFDELAEFAESQRRRIVIRVGTGIGVGKIVMPRLVRDFNRIHPDIDVRVTVNNSATIEGLLLRNELDIGIMEGTVNSGKLVRSVLQANPIVAVCHRDNPLARRKNLSLKDLADQDILLREQFSDTREAMDGVFARHGIRVKPIWECVSALALINAVSENLGVSFLPLNHLEALGNANIVVLKIKGLNQKHYLNIVHGQHKRLTPAIRTFIDHCRSHMRP